MLHVNSDGGFWEKPSFRLAEVANERTNSGHAQREREALSWRIWRQSQSRTCHEIIIKTFLIVFRQIYTITYRLFKISTFNAFVKLTKAVTFLFVICQILSPMTNWRSASASPDWHVSCFTMLLPLSSYSFSTWVYMVYFCMLVSNTWGQWFYRDSNFWNIQAPWASSFRSLLWRPSIEKVMGQASIHM